MEWELQAGVKIHCMSDYQSMVGCGGESKQQNKRKMAISSLIGTENIGKRGNNKDDECKNSAS